MKIAIAVIVAVIVVGGAYFFFTRSQTATPAPALTADTSAVGTVATSTPVSATTVPATSPNTVSYDGTKFSPASVTIANGGAVQFINNSSGMMWVASDPHPTHQGYSGTTVDKHCPDTTGTAFDECTAVPQGGVYTFVFKKVGSWGYHNHANHDAKGTVVVTP